MLAWDWEFDSSFDHAFSTAMQLPSQNVRWVNYMGDPIQSSGVLTVVSDKVVKRIIHGDLLGSV
jgi:hypothetical protein